MQPMMWPDIRRVIWERYSICQFTREIAAGGLQQQRLFKRKTGGFLPAGQSRTTLRRVPHDEGALISFAALRYVTLAVALWLEFEHNSLILRPFEQWADAGFRHFG